MSSNASQQPTAWWAEAYRIVLFYRYVSVTSTEALKMQLELCCASAGQMLGRVLVAEEGVNGTLAAPASVMAEFVRQMQQDERFALVDWKYSDVACSASNARPFPSLNIRIVSQIISVGAPKIDIPTVFDPTTFGGLAQTGQHLSPRAFHEALQQVQGQGQGQGSGEGGRDPNVLIIDVRNRFESDIGRFEGSIPIDTTTYAESWTQLDRIVGLGPAASKQNRKEKRAAARLRRSAEREGGGGGMAGEFIPSEDVAPPAAAGEAGAAAGEASSSSSSGSSRAGSTVRQQGQQQVGSVANKTVYMYCTGGIRCEKASSYLLARGVGQVFQLQGGVHRYLEEFGVAGADSDATSAPAPAVAPAAGETAATSLFRGKNFVFDSRGTSCLDVDVATKTAAAAATDTTTAVDVASSLTVGQCILCSIPHDTYNGFLTCCVCRVPLLVCDACVASSPHRGQFHCTSHQHLRHCYFAALDVYTADELSQQKSMLQQLLDGIKTGPNRKGAKTSVLARQIQKIDALLEKRREGVLPVAVQNPQVGAWVRQSTTPEDATL